MTWWECCMLIPAGVVKCGHITTDMSGGMDNFLVTIFPNSCLSSHIWSTTLMFRQLPVETPLTGVQLYIGIKASKKGTAAFANTLQWFQKYSFKRRNVSHICFKGVCWLWTFHDGRRKINILYSTTNVQITVWSHYSDTALTRSVKTLNLFSVILNLCMSLILTISHVVADHWGLQKLIFP